MSDGRPQSQPALAGRGLGLDVLEARTMRPQTAQAPRVKGDRPLFKPPVSRPQSSAAAMVRKPRDMREPVAGFDAAVRAKTPPWVFTQTIDVTNTLLKGEYEAMVDKDREDAAFSQKLNKPRPKPVQQHMKKDWRYYQHCGSKGNVWSDLHMTPEDRRHLVVTPTVLRGYDQQMRTVAKHLRSEQEVAATRMERVVYERQIRRFRLQEQQRTREILVRCHSASC